MPLYTMPDGNDYEFSNDSEATLALEAWEKQFGNKFSLAQKLTAGINRAAETLPAYIDENFSNTIGKGILNLAGVEVPDGTNLYNRGAEASAINASKMEHEAGLQSNLPTQLVSGFAGYIPGMLGNLVPGGPVLSAIGGAQTFAATNAAQNRYAGRAYGMEDTKDYELSGKLFGAATGAIPGWLSGGFGKRVLTGGGINAGLAGGQALVENKITEGHPELYTDPIVAALIGGGVGGTMAGLFGKAGDTKTIEKRLPKTEEEVKAFISDLDNKYIENLKLDEELRSKDKVDTTNISDMPTEHTSNVAAYKQKYGDLSPENARTKVDEEISKINKEITHRETKLKELLETSPDHPDIKKITDYNESQKQKLVQLEQEKELISSVETELKSRSPYPDVSENVNIPKPDTTDVGFERWKVDKAANSIASYIQAKEKVAKAKDNTNVTNKQKLELLQKATNTRDAMMKLVAKLGIPDTQVGKLFQRVERNLAEKKIASHGLDDFYLKGNKEQSVVENTRAIEEEDDVAQGVSKVVEEESPPIADTLNNFVDANRGITSIGLEHITDTNRLYISKHIPPVVSKLVLNVIKILKLDKTDKPLLVLTNHDVRFPNAPLGRHYTSHLLYDVVYLNLDKTNLDFIKTRYPNAYEFAMRYANKDPDAGFNLFQSYVVLHELGHHFVIQALKSGWLTKGDWDALFTRYSNWYKKNVSKSGAELRTFPEQFYKGNDLEYNKRTEKHNLEYYGKFGEFLAEDFARYFLFDNIPTKGRTNGFKAIAESIRKAFNWMIAHLNKEYNINMVSLRPVFIQEFIKKAFIDSELSDNIWMGTKVSYSDAWKMLQQHPLFTGEPDPTIEGVMHSSDLSEEKNQPYYFQNIPDLPGGILDNLFGKLSSRLFGRNVLDELYKHPIIQEAYKTIRNANNTVATEFNKLWQGYVPFNEKQGIHTSRKITDDSIDAVFKRSSNRDFYQVLEVFQQGRQAKMHYQDALKTFGTNLTKQQKELFETLAKYFKNLHKTITKIQSLSGVRPEKMLPFAIGWYPVTRQGKYHVRMRLPSGDTARFQSFGTEGEAKRFIKQVEKDPRFTGWSHEMEVANLGEGYSSASLLIDNINQSSLLNQAEKDVIDSIAAKLFNRPKGYTKHYVHRGDVPGYMGNELYKSSEQLGSNWKRAIISNHKEYKQSTINMLINRKLNIFTGPNSIIRNSHPNVHRIVSIMQANSTNKNKSIFLPEFEEKVNNLLASLAIKSAQTLGHSVSLLPFKSTKHFGTRIEEWSPTRSVLSSAHSTTARMFYILSLTSRPSFWAAQALTAPTAVRHMFKFEGKKGNTKFKGNSGNFFDALMAFGTGTMQMLGAFRDKQFKEALHNIAQNSDSFHPQFLNEYPMFSNNVEKILEKISGEFISGKADSFSRIWTFSMMYDFYRRKGIKGRNLERMAQEATDKTMIMYSRQDRGAWVDKGGFATEAAAPLTTFMLGQYGNLIADIKEFKNNPKAKTLAPLVATGLVTLLLTGAIGLPMVAEYELLRKVLQEVDPDIKLPSIIEWAQGHSELAEFGLVGLSHFDFGSGLRWNPLLSIAAENPGMDNGILTAFPGVNFAIQQTKNFGTVFKHDIMNPLGAGKQVTEAEYRRAYLSFFPAIVKGIEDARLFNANERTMVPNASGAGTVPQTAKEQLATFLGTRTTTKAHQDRTHRIMTADEEKRRELLRNATQVLVDGILSGDNGLISYGLDQYIKLGTNPRTLQEMIKDEYLRRNTEQQQRDVFGTSTNINVTPLQGQKFLRQEELQHRE